MRLLVTRPADDAEAMRAALEAAGHLVVVEPLLVVEPVSGPALVLDGVQALIATSRNALRALVARGDLATARDLPLIAVGPGTSGLARELGFDCVIEGPAAARDLPNVIGQSLAPCAGTIVHLAGEALAFDLAGALARHGFDVQVVTVYRSVPVAALSVNVCRDLDGGRIDGVVLMSPATAATYADLVRRHGLEAATRSVVHLCLSQAVADRLVGLDGARSEVALRPNAQQMLALVARVAAQSTNSVNSR